MGSTSSRLLADALGAKRIKHTASKFKGRVRKKLINWGSTSLPSEAYKCGKIINNVSSVCIASNKLETFKHLEDSINVNIPEFTTDRDEVLMWLASGDKVLARRTLNGHSGTGIVVMNEDTPVLVDAPLYTKYIRKVHEYRVHVVNGEVIDVTRKARNRSVPDEEVNWEIRNSSNGFIFMREGVELPEVAKQMAINTIDIMGLDFGAIDLIYNESQDKYYVLEVNTAPGITGTTVDKYVNAMRNNFGGF